MTALYTFTSVSEAVAALCSREGPALRARLAELEAMNPAMTQKSQRIAKANIAAQISQCIEVLGSTLDPVEVYGQRAKMERVGAKCAELDHDEECAAEHLRAAQEYESLRDQAAQVKEEQEAKIQKLLEVGGFAQIEEVPAAFIEEEEYSALMNEIVEYQREYVILSRAAKEVDGDI